MKPNATGVAEMRPECDFSSAVRGKCHNRLAREGSNAVALEPDMAKAFPDSASVNEALRVVLKGASGSTSNNALERAGKKRGSRRRAQGKMRAVAADASWPSAQLGRWAS